MTVQRDLELGIVAFARDSVDAFRTMSSRLVTYGFQDQYLGWIWERMGESAAENEAPRRESLDARSYTEADPVQPALREVIAEVWQAIPSTAPLTDIKTLQNHRRHYELVQGMDRVVKALDRGDLSGAEDIFRRAASSPLIGEAAPLLQPLALAELLRSGDSQVEWDVEPIIARATGTSLSGLAGAGKTWLLLDLAIEVARGGLWLGKFQCSPGCVVYVDEESRDRLLRRRLQRILRGKGLEPDQVAGLQFIVMAGINLSDPASVARFKATLGELKPRMVIVDSFIRVHREKENDATEMAKVSRVIQRLMQDLDCSFVFADHQRKPNALGESDTRGSTEKAAIQDQLLLVRRAKGGAIIVEHRKSRYAPELEPFEVELEDQDADDEAKAITIAKWSRVATNADAEEQASGDADVIARLLNGTMPRIQVIALCKNAHIPEKRATAALKLLEAQRRIERITETGATGGKRYLYRHVAGTIGNEPSDDTSAPNKFQPPVARHQQRQRVNLDKMKVEQSRIRAIAMAPTGAETACITAVPVVSGPRATSTHLATHDLAPRRSTRAGSGVATSTTGGNHAA